MTDNQVSKPTNSEEFDKLILNEFPCPIAASYQKLLKATTWRAKIDEGLKLFEFGLRTVALVLINQYLNEDIQKVNDESFNQLLLSKLPEATLGSWVELFFRCLQVYDSKQKLFFTPELHEILWDTSKQPHTKRKGARGSFQRLVELRNARAHLRLADTEENAQEVLQNLQATIAKFTFIRQYDLIRVTEKLDEEQCLYDIYRGLTITADSGKLKLWRKGDKHLHQNWFYLLRKTSGGREVLELHPFLVAWVRDAQTAPQEEAPPHSVALYDRLLKTKVTYISLPDQVLIEHERPLLDQVRSILYFVIEEQRMGQGGKTRFSWPELKAAAQELTVRNMKGVQQKYSPELYLQREETFLQFNDFLASDKTGFILTGKSGVGKSNFVLSLADAYANQDQLCYLMYDGARLSVPEKMQDAISQDLGRRLELVNTMREDFFTTLKHIGLMTHRQMLVVFDAINENANGKELLQKIDRLVDFGDDFPWLKVLITSRPQAWRTLKRGLHLAQENYFQPKGGDDLAIEMAEFAIKLEEFERGELEQAYEKYRVVYRLQTPYTDLPISIRETLRDPLVLRLVADIYRGKALPKTVRVSDIYKKYVDALIKTARLKHEDIFFLEQEIMPRLLSAEHFDNKLTTTLIAQAKTSDGRPLWEMIRVSEQLRDGEAINASYQRLANAEILIEQGSPTDYEVSFKYERFYDYYGGKRLQELAKDKSSEELLEIYERWILATRKHPFLWGSVQSALLNELKKGKEDLIISLCQTDEQLTKDMMVATLTEYGQEEMRVLGTLNTIESSLQKLITLGIEKISFWQKRLPFSDVKFAQGFVNARKTAVDVAANIGSSIILEKGVLDRSAIVRNHAVLRTMNLWEKEKEIIEKKLNAYDNNRSEIEDLSSVIENRGFSVIRSLDKNIRMGVLPNIQAAQSALTMLLFLGLVHFNAFRKGKEQKLGQELRQLARSVLDELLYMDNKKGLKFAVSNLVRDQIVSFMVAWTNRTVEDTPEKTTFNANNISTFLQRTRSEKEVMYIITKCINSKNKDIEPLAQALTTILELNEGSTDYALQFALIAQWENNKERVLEIATELFERGMQRSRPDYTIYVPLNLLHSMLIHGKADTSLENLYVEWWKRLQAKARGRVFFSGNEHLRFQVAGYFELQNVIRGTIDTETPKAYVQQAKDEKDIGWMKAIINELGDVSKQKELLRPSLEVVSPLLNYQDQEIQERIINMLARMRRLDEYAVDDYLVERELSDEFKTRVKNAEVKGAVGGIFIYGPGSRFIVDAISYSTDLQQVAIWILNQTIETHDFNEFINRAIRRIINLIYGLDIFELPQ